MIREPITSISFKDVSFKTQNGSTLFSNFSLDIPVGKIIWIKGASGVGKSVIIKMICGILQPSSGAILINNKPLNEMSFEEFTPLRCNMGYSFDFGGLISNRTILANLLLQNEYHTYDFGSPDDLVSRVSKYIDLFNLKEVANERPSSIVGGLRKAACVARAFVHEPELLLLDDPTTGLRRETQDHLKKLIQAKRAKGESKHIIIATEDAAFMKDLSATIIEVDEYKIDTKQKASAA